MKTRGASSGVPYKIKKRIDLNRGNHATPQSLLANRETAWDYTSTCYQYTGNQSGGGS